MDTDHILEWVVLGGAFITFLYHFVLYIQQKDKYLLLYANYLFSLTIYLTFRRLTNYDSFEYSENRLAFAIDYPLILYMLVSYVYFISLILDIHNNGKVIKIAVYGFYIWASLFFVEHLYKIIFTDEAYLTRTYFAVSKSIMVGFAFIGLSGAWYIRKTTFVRLILVGGFLYALFSLFTIVSVYFEIPILGMHQYDLYFVGCLLDIVMFSSALGYRSHLINLEKIKAQSELTRQSQMNEELLIRQQKLLENENKQRQVLLDLNKTIQMEIGSRLSSIHIYTELASKEINTDWLKSKTYLDKASEMSKKLMTDMGDILWIAYLPEEIDPKELIARIHELSIEFFKESEIKYSIFFSNAFYNKMITKKMVSSYLTLFKRQLDAINQTHASVRITFDGDGEEAIVSMEYDRL